MKNKIIQADNDSWMLIRKKFPNLSDAKRTKILASIVQDFDLESKCRPEPTDTFNDKVIKKMMRIKL